MSVPDSLMSIGSISSWLIMPYCPHANNQEVTDFILTNSCVYTHPGVKMDRNKAEGSPFQWYSLAYLHQTGYSWVFALVCPQNHWFTHYHYHGFYGQAYVLTNQLLERFSLKLTYMS